MLISHRIATDLTFLHLAFDFDRRDAEKLIDLRVKIMRATKVVVGTEFVNIDATLGYEGNAQTFSDGSPILIDPDAPKKEMKDLTKDLSRRFELYSKYARLPFKLVVFENERGLYLIEQKTPFSFQIVTVKSDGEIDPISVVVDLQNLSADTNVQIDLTFLYSKAHLEKTLLSRPRAMEVLQVYTGQHTYKVLDTLLHFNVSNNRIHKYALTKKEVGKVPPAMIPHYVYHVLDVFRERTTYHSLPDVEAAAEEHQEVTTRKAHVVRGHFKEIRGQLFWWSSFVRCRKNADTAGMVVSDYVLH